MKIYSTYGSTHGIWHTGWVNSKNKKKSEQVFRIKQMFIDDLDFTYKEVKRNMADCVDKARELGLGVTEGDYAILRSFLRDFLSDVDTASKKEK